MNTTPLYESHLHTPLCKHAYGELEEYGEFALKRGLDGIIVTCHNPLPDGMAPEVRMSEAEFPDYLERVSRARRFFEGRLDIRLGLECDYIPDLESYLEKQVASAPFDFLLGSIHPHLDYYRERYACDEPGTFYRTYFHNLACAAESGLFDAVAHPDVVKRYYPDDWDLEGIMEEVKEVLDRIAASGVAMELNTAGLRGSIKEPFPGPEILVEMRERGIPVTLGSDAHRAHAVAANWEDAFDALETAGYTEIRVFLERTPITVPIQAARRQLVPPPEETP